MRLTEVFDRLPVFRLPGSGHHSPTSSGHSARPRGPASGTVHRRSDAWRRWVVAAACGLATVVLVWSFTPSTTGTRILVADAEVLPGERIAAGDVTMRVFPEELVPTGALRSLDEVVGATSAVHLSPGAPVLPGSMLGGSETALPEGTVLVPVTITDEAVARTLRAGNTVRIYASPDVVPTGVDGPLGTDGDESIAEATVHTISLVDDAALGSSRAVVTLAVDAMSAPSLARSAGAKLGYAILQP